MSCDGVDRGRGRGSFDRWTSRDEASRGCSAIEDVTKNRCAIFRMSE